MTRDIRLHTADRTAGLRLDQALAELLPDLSRTRLAKLIREGAVLVGGLEAKKSSIKLAEGDVIDVHFPDPSATGVRAQELPLEVVFQDSDVAVINKPPGIVVHPSAGHADGTLVNALLHHISDLSGIGGELRPGIVHRLDKDTSGLIVIAKNDTAHRALTSAWNSEQVRKEYLAIVYGTPRQDEGIIEAAIGRDPHDRRRMGIVASGRHAITRYKIVERLRHTSLIRCRLETGRTHQIRIHLKSLGHPIVGDALYSGPQWKGVPHRPTQKALAAFTRQALHAALLEFPHPGNRQVLTFEASLPHDMQALLEALRQTNA